MTQTSGRGVGLDVVYSHVVSHGGSLTLKSEASKGSTTELRLPVSLISTHALLVRMRGQVIAVADRGIEQILHAADGKERKLGDQITFQVGQQLYPLRRLDEILGLAPDLRASQRAPDAGTAGERPYRNHRGPGAGGIGRHRPGGEGVRPLRAAAAGNRRRHHPRRRRGHPGAGSAGADERGPSGRRGRRASAAAADAQQEDRRLPLALVVDDSLSARRALAQVMADAGYEVREARDGLEAVEIAQGRRPDIVLADMEMPRMNGIELTSHLRARPETVDLPVIMITSRSTAKHRQQAEAAGVNVYLTKPFLDDQLLDQVAALRGQL